MIELHLTTAEVDYILDFVVDEFDDYNQMTESLFGFMFRVQAIIEDALERDWSE